MYREPFSKKVAEQVLWENTIVHPDTGCYLWLGSLNDKGYGQLTVLGRHFKTNRLAAHLFLGLKYNSIMHVLHKTFCPNRNCWRPEHLYIGDIYQNMRDRSIVNEPIRNDKGYILGWRKKSDV